MDMVSVLRLRANCFGDANPLCCSGEQLSRLVCSLERELGPLNWFVSDVRPGSKFELREDRNPTKFGTTDSLAVAAENVLQFESGVFLAVPATIACPRLRSEILTDDPTNVDLGDAVVEIRAFDSTFFEIITQKDAISTMLSSEYGGTIDQE